ncbi:hypothetical protein EV1_012513 [Malus domestica]
MADEIVVGSADLPVKRPREEEENGAEAATSAVSMEADGGKESDSVSAVIPGWFSEISLMWPDSKHCSKDQRNKNKPTGFSPNPPKNPVSGAKRVLSDAIDGCSEKWAFTMTNGFEVDVGKAAGLSSPLAKNEVSSLPLSPKPAAQLEKKNTQASEHTAASSSYNVGSSGATTSKFSAFQSRSAKLSCLRLSSLHHNPLRVSISGKKEFVVMKGKMRGSGAMCYTYATPLSVNTLQFISTISTTVLFLAKMTVVQKSFLVPLFLLQMPATVISWIKGEYGIWAAFLVFLVRLFFFIPGRKGFRSAACKHKWVDDPQRSGCGAHE